MRTYQVVCKDGWRVIEYFDGVPSGAELSYNTELDAVTAAQQCREDAAEDE